MVLPLDAGIGQANMAFEVNSVPLSETILSGLELCGKVGDGVNQAADLISATASIPSLNFIPLTTFGNWF